MSRNAHQIRQEIEQTRSHLAQNLEAIGDRVSPKHVVEQITDKVSPRRLINRQTEKVKDGLQNVTDSVMGKATDAVDGARDALGEATSSGSGSALHAASVARDGVKGQAQSLTERVRSVSTTAAGQVRSVPDSNPMGTALLALGAGLVVGLALPPSRKERQTAGTVRDQVVEPLKQQAVQAGKSVAGELQPAAQTKVERVRRSATDAADRVREEARGAATDVPDQAGQAAASVKGRARQASQATSSNARTTAKRTTGQVRQRVSA